MLQGLLEPEFYGNLVYMFRKIVCRPKLSDYFSEIAICFKRKGYNIVLINSLLA